MSKVGSKWIIIVLTRVTANIYWRPTMCKIALGDACKGEDNKSE